MRESALPPSLLARGGVWADAIYAWHLARLRWDGLLLRAQDLFAPKTSSRPRPLRAQDLFAPKTSIAAGARYMRRLWRIYHAQNRPPGDRLAFAFMAYNAGAGSVIRFRHAARSSRGTAFTWAQVCPFAWKEPRHYVERIERWRPRFGGKEYHIFPFHGVKGTCSLAGDGAAPHDLLAKTIGGGWSSAPQTFGENKRRGVRGAHVHDPAKAKAVARNIIFSPFMGSRGLVSLAGCGAALHKPLVKTRGGGCAGRLCAWKSPLCGGRLRGCVTSKKSRTLE